MTGTIMSNASIDDEPFDASFDLTAHYALASDIEFELKRLGRPEFRVRAGAFEVPENLPSCLLYDDWPEIPHPAYAIAGPNILEVLRAQKPDGADWRRVWRLLFRYGKKFGDERTSRWGLPDDLTQLCTPDLYALWVDLKDTGHGFILPLSRQFEERDAYHRAVLRTRLCGHIAARINGPIYCSTSKRAAMGQAGRYAPQFAVDRYERIFFRFERHL